MTIFLWVFKAQMLTKLNINTKNNDIFSNNFYYLKYTENINRKNMKHFTTIIFYL